MRNPMASSLRIDPCGSDAENCCNLLSCQQVLGVSRCIRGKRCGLHRSNPRVEGMAVNRERGGLLFLVGADERTWESHRRTTISEGLSRSSRFGDSLSIYS